MYIIIFILALIALAGVGFLIHMENENARVDRQQNVRIVRMSAEQGAQIFNACEKETTSGVYSVADMIASQYLPTGYPTSTPFGPQWGCEVSSGGTNGNNVYLLLLSGPFTNLTGLGNTASQTSGSTLQSDIAWNMAQDISPQVDDADNVVVGVLPSGTTSMTSVVNKQQYSLSGLVDAPAYTTPIITANLVASNY